MLQYNRKESLLVLTGSVKPKIKRRFTKIQSLALWLLWIRNQTSSLTESQA